MQQRFAILRVAKMRGPGQVAASAAHLTRTRETPNADPARKQFNIIWANKTVEAAMGDWRRQLGTVDRKVRKDAVTCLEYVFTYSPGALDNQKAGDYFSSCSKWLEARHGKDRIILGAAHYDETTPHMHVLVVPIREQVNKKGQKVTALNAKHWLDGSKKLSEMQTDFANTVGKAYDLDRGIKGSRARHERVQRFYGGLEPPERPQIDIPKATVKDRIKTAEYEQRIIESVEDQLGAAWGRMRATAERENEPLRYRVSAAEQKVDTIRDYYQEQEKAIQAKADQTMQQARQISANLERSRQEAKAEAEKRQAAEKENKKLWDFIKSASPEDLKKTQENLRQQERNRGGWER